MSSNQDYHKLSGVDHISSEHHRTSVENNPCDGIAYIVGYLATMISILLVGLLVIYYCYTLEDHSD